MHVLLHSYLTIFKCCDHILKGKDLKESTWINVITNQWNLIGVIVVVVAVTICK